VSRLRVSLFALVTLLALSAVACGSVRPYAAIVNSHRVGEKDVTDELNSIRKNARYLDAIDPSRRQILGSGTNTFSADFTAQVLTRRVYYELIHDELVRRHQLVTEGQLNAAKQTVIQQFNGPDIFNAFPASYQRTLERRTAEVAQLARSLGGTPSDAALQAYYQAHQADLQQACVSHILVDTKDRADAIEARLAKSEDFAAVAKAESKDSGSAQKGGEVGCFFKDAQLVPEFLQATFSQPVGQVGPPVQSQFGFHIIKVTSRQTPPFDQVKAQITTQLSQGNEQKLTDWLRTALGKVRITINPKFGKWDKNQQTPGVVPPQAPTSRTTGPGPAGIGGGGATNPSP